MTLIRSNPAFKPARTKFFYDHFNRLGKTIEEVALVFRQIDLMCNAINEKTGHNIDSEEMYLMVISHINDHQYPLHEVDVSALYLEMESLVFKHLPLPYSADTHIVLEKLTAVEGPTFSLLSNTAFIKGSTLKTVLKRIELDSYFDFQLYSDETGMSKPNEKFFQLMLDKVKEVRGGEQFSTQEIIHIGDNIKADILGAESLGISSLLINSNERTILTLIENGN